MCEAPFKIGPIADHNKIEICKLKSGHKNKLNFDKTRVRCEKCHTHFFWCDFVFSLVCVHFMNEFFPFVILEMMNEINIKINQ